MSRVPVRRALLSVTDTTGLAVLAKRLAEAGVELVASGGTGAFLHTSAIPFTPLAALTGTAEMLGGLVKTLHPAVYVAVLADRGDEHHMEVARSLGGTLDLIVVNLYDFEATVTRGEEDPAVVTASIDIGGPTLLRAGAKNSTWVGVVTSPEQYEEVATEVEGGGLTDELRQRLAREAFFRTAAYDTAIVAWLERDEPLPERLLVPLRRQQTLRYGENPHQSAAVYVDPTSGSGEQGFAQQQGKPLSFNNILDATAATRLVAQFDGPAVAIVKHTNPCGVAVASSISAALETAWDCDPTSAFGGVVAANRTVDQDTAQHLKDVFIEVLVAPAVSDDALEVLSEKPNLRVLSGELDPEGRYELRRAGARWLGQVPDQIHADRNEWKVVSKASPVEEQWRDLEFAWKVAAHTKSNAVVVAKDLAALGVGAGDQSRLGAAERAVHRAAGRAVGGSAASDAFFPFRDGLDVLAAAGVTAVVEPGGSKKDAEVIAAADEHGLALVFTSRRHFRH